MNVLLCVCCLYVVYGNRKNDVVVCSTYKICMSVWTDVDVYYMVFTDVFTERDETALMKASGGGHTGAMELLLAKNADVNTKDGVRMIYLYF